MNILLKGSLAKGNYDLEVDRPGFTGEGRILFFRKTDSIYNLCPSDAGINFKLCEKEDIYSVDFEILCGHGPFEVKAEKSSIESAMNDLSAQMETKLSVWRSERFKEEKMFWPSEEHR